MAEFRAIELAIEVATRQRDALARNLAQARRNLEFANGQMEQLSNYAADTDGRWTQAQQASRCGELVRHHYQFVERLQHAIGMQSHVIGDLKGQMEAAHRILLQAEFRLSGLNQVLQGKQAARQLKQRRREQQHTDEFAALRHLHARVAQQQGENHEH
jgi:flagellar FliJ protein